jgi:tetratricopeptide (TPR) repeat protein
MKKLCSLVVGLLVSWSLSGYATVLFSGEWSYQALNAGDTSFKVKQEGSKITFYRVMFPEFEGERYKLEHMYRGKITGNKIEGKLFVREEGMPDFETLRVFRGEIQSNDKMLMDDMPLKRIGTKVIKEAEAPAETPPESKYAKVVINRGAKPGDSAKADKATGSAPIEIPELIPVGRRVLTADGKKAQKLLEEADGQLEKRNYQAATAKYEQALALNAHKVEILYKLGIGHGNLGTEAAKKGSKEKAREHYLKAIKFWTKAYRYDPYNWGATENIRRAKKKIAKLKK